MSTMATAVSMDELQALEEKVLRTVELIKKEREMRAVAEKQVAELQEQLALQQMEQGDLQKELSALKGERENVRGRVERLLEQMESL